jgi:hypothetical protein
MITKKHVMLITFGACILGLSALGSLKNPVTRPLKGQGHVTVVVNLVDGTWTSTEVANWTHFGLVTSIGTGYTDPQSGLPVGGGTVTTANGEQLYWSCPNSPAVTLINGGTGRFEFVSGRITGVYFNVVYMPDPDDPSLLIMDQDLYGEGTITY